MTMSQHMSIHVAHPTVSSDNSILVIVLTALERIQHMYVIKILA